MRVNDCLSDNSDNEDGSQLFETESASQVTGLKSASSKSIELWQDNLDQKRAEIKAAYDLEKARAMAEAETLAK